MLKEEVKDLVLAYQRAGSSFLAYRMRSIFDAVTDEESRVLHNEALSELREMLGERLPQFLEAVSKELLNLASLPDDKKSMENEDGK